jgi:polyhydroxyalkanoate synthase
MQLALEIMAALQAATGEFATRHAGALASSAGAGSLAVYDDWIDCAERTYGRRARSREFCRLQADLINVSCALRGDLAPAAALAFRQEGCSLREEVWRLGKTALYRYLPLPFVQRAHARPLLICYAQVNRPSVLDLEPRCSLIRRLAASGHAVYLIDWGYPGEAERDTPLAHYLTGHIGGAVAHILRTEACQALDMIGICHGGTLSLCYAALHPRQVANLVLLGTPVDFQTPEDLLSRWVAGLDTELVCRAGNMPGAALTAAFLALAPFRLLQQKYVHLLASGPSVADIQRFMRLERWILDSPDQPATAFAQFLRWLYQENRLARGELTLGGKRVRLERVRQPVLNVYATRDHIVPPAASRALRGRTASRDYAELAVETGHIGMFVSRAAIDVPWTISAWLAERAR